MENIHLLRKEKMDDIPGLYFCVSMAHLKEISDTVFQVFKTMVAYCGHRQILLEYFLEIQQSAARNSC